MSTAAPALHPRNRHQGRYDFPALIKICPELARFVITNPYGKPSIDFANPEAVKVFNRALLRQHYSNRPEALLAHVSHETFRNWGEIVGGSCGYVECGLIATVAMSGPDDPNVARMRANIALQNSVGIHSEALTADDLRRLQPFARFDDIVIGGPGFQALSGEDSADNQGQVEARSDGAGLGSEFIVRLPLRTGAPIALPVISGQLPRATLTGRRILVVDDAADCRESLGEVLRIAGGDVRTAVDGVAGLEVAAVFDPEIVLLDIRMPKMDGYETARQLRASPRGEKLILIDGS